MGGAINKNIKMFSVHINTIENGAESFTFFLDTTGDIIRQVLNKLSTKKPLGCRYWRIQVDCPSQKSILIRYEDCKKDGMADHFHKANLERFVTF